PTLDPGVLRELLLPAFTVLVVAFSDDVVTARSFAGRDEKIVANRELLALGLANAGASLVRGFPVSSSGTRTAIAIAAGRKTQAYSLATAASVLVVLLVRVARPHDAIQGTVPGLAGMHDVDDYPDAQTIPGLVVYRYDAPLCFANAEDFRRRALGAADREPDLHWFVLNVEANVE